MAFGLICGGRLYIFRLRILLFCSTFAIYVLQCIAMELCEDSDIKLKFALTGADVEER